MIARRKHSIAPKCIATAWAASIPSIPSAGLKAASAAAPAAIRRSVPSFSSPGTKMVP